jgi:energy-coupling factor transporter ATP-binding protein EcfA2/ribosomal protein L31E
MDITLYEEVNLDRLREVINCNNIPFTDSDNKEWVERVPTRLKQYVRKKFTTKGVEIKYTQSKKIGGRYTTDRGLQFFQKDIRKYLSQEYVKDYDFENCHPVILEQLFKKNGIYAGEFLEDYNKNRNATMTKYNIKSKLDVIKMINNEKVPTNFIFRDLHYKIYNDLVPKLIKENASLFRRVKSERSKNGKFNNEKGGFFSQYLQIIENELLMSFYKYLNSKCIKVHTLMFDGLTVDKKSDFDIEEARLFIKEETGYNINIVEKSMETDWRPIVNAIIKEQNEEIEIRYKPSINKKLYEDCYKKIDEQYNFDYEAINVLTTYINNFVCKINQPLCYGFRTDINKTFEMTTVEKIKDRIRYGFTTKQGLETICWKNQDNSLEYDRFVFSVDESKVRKTEYNTYKRPEMEKCDDSILDIEYFRYLKEVISNNDEDSYFYLINHTAKMVQVGQTKQTLVFLGQKGCGKSSYANCLGYIIGKEYTNLVDDINKITNNFNSLSEKSILTQVEEVVSNAGEYHRVQSMLKTLITEEDIRIEKKGIDAYIVKSNNNFILITNENNPVQITKDQRRFFVCRVSNIRRNDWGYFKKMIDELIENIKKVRYYFYNYDYVDDLNSIRPKTQAEIELLNLNKTSVDKFIEDGFILDGEEDDERRILTNIYNDYKEFCHNNQIDKIKKINYFSQSLVNAGFKKKRIRCDGQRLIYIQGFNNIDINYDSE